MTEHIYLGCDNDVNIIPGVPSVECPSLAMENTRSHCELQMNIYGMVYS